MNIQRLIEKIRRRAYQCAARRRLGMLGSGAVLSGQVQFLHPKNITIGAGCVLDRGVRLKADPTTSITIGDRCLFGDFAILATDGGNIRIGDDCSVNPFCVLYGHGGLTIGNDVRIATHTVIVPANHRFAERSLPIRSQGTDLAPVTIADDVWIGASVTVTAGVQIGRGSVVGAGAVITKSIPEYEIWAGVPARKIGER